MKLKFSIVMMCAALSLAACTNPDRFGNGGEAGADPFANGAGAGGAGSASDPASPAYFQQAVGDRVLFAVDQSSISPEGRATLDAQAVWLLQNADYTAVIEGHADEQGTREYNLALGARRADAARAYLVGQGVQASRLQVVSYGKERPIEVCSDEACYAKNRRAVTVLAGGLTS
ncbi:peptidoglycan-associated lipoprotein Pal [uncultured Tateyamaria sp.]|uniref:peptidoglycan-associated lipoprotein Pal n=1 Tax=uncultured Tateyamaria sp. TaxID=455651 RepID=UPI0026354ED6|nr:peptidoglycan-associated lipoprotein Pal [uncultured Tateyamaria sp.]